MYIRQTQSELTGEHTIVMVRGLRSSTDEELGWLGEFSKGRFIHYYAALVIMVSSDRLPKAVSHPSIIQVPGI